MFEPALASVFAGAAIPQKIVLVVLAASIPATAIAAALACRRRSAASLYVRWITELRLAGPALGLLVGAMNGFHMGRTIQRLPISPTAKQLAPGILEISTLIGLGVLAGVVAMVTHHALGLAAKDR